MDVHLVQLQLRKLLKKLAKQFGLKINKTFYRIKSSIRAIGSVEVPVKLHKEVIAEI